MSLKRHCVESTVDNCERLSWGVDSVGAKFSIFPTKADMASLGLEDAVAGLTLGSSWAVDDLARRREQAFRWVGGSQAQKQQSKQRLREVKRALLKSSERVQIK
jgi:hypothetical protein